MPKPISRTSHRTGSELVSKEESSGAANESTPRKSRRRFTASEKLRVLEAASAAEASGERGAVQALLRREGLYRSQLSSWRRQLETGGSDGLKAKKRGRKPSLQPHERELQALTKRNAVLERKLRIAHGLIELQKKAHAILDLALPESSEEK